MQLQAGVFLENVNGSDKKINWVTYLHPYHDFLLE